ncbi:MAG: hypothetical protein COA63_000645 [Methylophaga sp.]|nr:hypothetical protein [Methylophaga sp.]
MFSLIITIQTIHLVAQQACLVTFKQYANEVETHLGHGEGYCIPSLIWPPPNRLLFCINTVSAQSAINHPLSRGVRHD